MKSTLTLSISSFSILNPLTSLSRDRIFALISTKITEKILGEKKKNTNQKNKLLANNIAWCYKLLFLMCAYITRGHQNVFKEQVALELAPKAQVLEGRRIQEHLTFRVSEMAFPGVFKRYFPLQMHVVSSKQQILGTMQLMCPRCFMTLHGLNVSQI